MTPRATTRLRRTIFLVLSGLLLLAPWIGASEAEPWLQKMEQMYERGPFSMDFTLAMKVDPGGGQVFEMSGKGSGLYADATRSRTSMEMEMAIPGMPEPLTTKVLTVSDGEYLWTEMDNPMMGGQMVMKVAIDDAMEQAAAAGFGMSSQGDPVSQIRALQQYVDFYSVEKAGGQVTLSGEFGEDLMSSMGAQAAMFDGAALRLVLDESTAVPQLLEITLPGSEPLMRMEVTRFELLDGVDDEEFSYTPAPGVQVMDPLAMSGARQ